SRPPARRPLCRLRNRRSSDVGVGPRASGFGTGLDRLGLSPCLAALPDSFSVLYRTPHVKLPASSVEPDPLYMAVCGYGQSGRVRTTLPSTTRGAGIVAGATPFSTHCTSGVSPAELVVAAPPAQRRLPD